MGALLSCSRLDEAEAFVKIIMVAWKMRRLAQAFFMYVSSEKVSAATTLVNLAKSFNDCDDADLSQLYLFSKA